MRKHPFAPRRLASIAVSSLVAGILISLGATAFLGIRQGGHSFGFHSSSPSASPASNRAPERRPPIWGGFNLKKS